MKKTSYIILVLFILSIVSCAGKKEKLFRVGILQGSDNRLADITEGFRSKMRELGYTEGENIIYDLQITGLNPEKQALAAKKFVNEKVNLIFAFATGPALICKNAVRGTDIPVVFAFSLTEGNGLIENVRHPGGTITGVREPGADLTIKRLELLRELLPNAKKVYISYNMDYPAIPPTLKQLRPAAQSMGITLIEAPAKSIPEIQADLQKRSRGGNPGIDAILTMPQPLTLTPPGFKALGKFADKYSIPIAGHLSNIEDYSTVFGYVPDMKEIGELAAPLADKILNGTPAGTIPVVTPESRLTLNYKKARKLGIRVSEGFLSKAHEVIR